MMSIRTKKALQALASLVCATVLAMASPFVIAANGDPIVLDDSRSHTVPANVQMQWLPQSASDPDAGMTGSVRVNIHLDVAEHIGQSGRIYLVMPRHDSISVGARWTSQGQLRSGQIRSGERALVYTGTIRSAALTDQFQMRLLAAPDWPSDHRRVRFHFELILD